MNHAPKRQPKQILDIHNHSELGDKKLNLETVFTVIFSILSFIFKCTVFSGDKSANDFRCLSTLLKFINL